MSVRLVSIGDVVEKISTWNPTSQGDGEFDYIDLSAIDQDTKRIVEPNRLSTSEAPSRARQLVAAGDVLVSTVRPNLNGVAKVGAEHEGMTASTGFCVLRPRKKLLSENYLFQWVKSPSFVKDMVQKATGASYPAVSDRIIKESLIPLPPLDEQKRIAAILDKADALRAKRRQAIALLDSLTQSIFLEMFGAERSVRKISQVASIRSGSTPSRSVPQNFGGSIPWVKTTEVKGKIINSTEETVTELGAASARLRLYRSGTVLMAMYGQGTTRGNVALLGIPATINQACAAIEPSQGLDPTFLFHQLRLKYDEIRSFGRGGNQPNLNLELVGNIEVIIPEISAQQRFTSLANELNKQNNQLNAAAEKSDALFTSLQHRAFAGQL